MQLSATYFCRAPVDRVWRLHAHVTLTPEDEGTRIAIDVHAAVGGTIARVGRRSVEGVVQQMMERFCKCLSKQAALNSAATRWDPSGRARRAQ